MTDQYSIPPALPDYTIQTDKPWSYKGRFGRLSYLAWTFALFFTFTIAVTVLTILSMIIGATVAHALGWIIGISLGLVLFIAMIYGFIVFQIRRLHDLNRTGWWVLLPVVTTLLTDIIVFGFPNTNFVLIPRGILTIITWIFTIYLMAGKGADGVNLYDSPRPTPQWEKTVGWISLALQIFAIFAIIYAITVSPTFREQLLHPKAFPAQPVDPFTAPTDISPSAS